MNSNWDKALIIVQILNVFVDKEKLSKKDFIISQKVTHNLIWYIEEAYDRKKYIICAKYEPK